MKYILFYKPYGVVCQFTDNSENLRPTLKDYIHALGGKLHLIVEFPNQEPIEIKDCEEFEEKELENQTVAKST